MQPSSESKFPAAGCRRRTLLGALPNGALLLTAQWALALTACGGGDDHDDTEAGRADDPMPAPNSDMQAVLDELALLGARPINELSTAQARSQPSLADAVRSLIFKRGGNAAPSPPLRTEDRVFDGPYGPVTVRLYLPPGAGPFPVLMYIHGGGWVLATIDTYDASARALCGGR